MSVERLFQLHGSICDESFDPIDNPSIEEIERILTSFSHEDWSYFVLTVTPSIAHNVFIQVGSNTVNNGEKEIHNYVLETRFEVDSLFQQYQICLEDKEAILSILKDYLSGQLPDVSGWRDITEPIIAKLIEKEVRKKGIRYTWNKEEGLSSIFHYIRTNLDSDGKLPENFSIQSLYLTTENDIGFGCVDGLMDRLYAEPAPPEVLYQVLELASQEQYDEAFSLAHEYFKDNMKVRAHSLLTEVGTWLVNKEDRSDYALLFFASRLIMETKNIEVLKLGLFILALYDIGGEVAFEYLMMVPAVCDEFTSFVLLAVNHWKNKNELAFSMAKKTHGWGKIKAVYELNPDREEIFDWLLHEGCKNSIMPQYTAYAVATKLNVAEMLQSEQLDYDTFSGISHIVDALLESYGGDPSVYQLEDIEDYPSLIENYVKHAKKQSLQYNDYETLWDVSIYVGDEEDNLYNEESQSIIEDMLQSPACKAVIIEALQEGLGYKIGTHIGLDTVLPAMQLIEKDPLEYLHLLSYVMENGTDEQVSYVVRLYEDLSCWESIEQGPEREQPVRELYKNNYMNLLQVLYALSEHVGVGERLVLLALGSVYSRARETAQGVIDDWVKQGYVPPEKTKIH